MDTKMLTVSTVPENNIAWLHWVNAGSTIFQLFSSGQLPGVPTVITRTKLQTIGELSS